MLQPSEDVLTMSLRQVRHSRRQRADEVLDASGCIAIARRRALQERLERHADDVRRTTPQAAGGSPERTTERGGQTDCDLIVHGMNLHRALQL